jgi:hypothetical protein
MDKNETQLMNDTMNVLGMYDKKIIKEEVKQEVKKEVKVEEKKKD